MPKTVYIKLKEGNKVNYRQANAIPNLEYVSNETGEIIGLLVKNPKSIKTVKETEDDD